MPCVYIRAHPESNNMGGQGELIKSFMNYKTLPWAKYCPKCGAPWGEYGTICAELDCDYERGFFKWLVTAAWPLGLLIVTLSGISLFILI